MKVERVLMWIEQEIDGLMNPLRRYEMWASAIARFEVRDNLP